MKQDATHSTLERLAARLDKERMPYVLVGGMALGLHGYERMTRDVDILLTTDGLRAFEERCVGRGYVAKCPSERRAYLDAQTKVPVEILCTGEFPGDGRAKPVTIPNLGRFRVNLFYQRNRAGLVLRTIGTKTPTVPPVLDELKMNRKGKFKHILAFSLRCRQQI